jgi:3-carboxy-cis,cis-muconate cycloisomerase
VAAGLQVFPERMRANLTADGELLMAEAYMMKLAPVLGRGEAHELVYDAVVTARRQDEPLIAVLRREAPAGARAALEAELRPEDYVGDPARAIAEAVREWRSAAACPPQDAGGR